MMLPFSLLWLQSNTFVVPGPSLDKASLPIDLNLIFTIKSCTDDSKEWMEQYKALVKATQKMKVSVNNLNKEVMINYDV